VIGKAETSIPRDTKSFSLKIREEENKAMTETIIVVIVLALIAHWIYKSGKREGSRKGFNVGIRKGRRRRR